MKLVHTAVLLAIFLLLEQSARGQSTALLAKALIDGTGRTISHPAVVIDGKKIVAVTSRERIPSGASIIDLGDYTILPGLIDMHVHPDLAAVDYQSEHLRTSSAAKALSGLKGVQALLGAGWTGLRVAGDADVGYANMEIKNAINRGLFVGPHIYGAAHYISVTGGHGDINFLSPEQKVTPDGLIADGPDEMRKAVRNEVKFGSDWIKIMVTGSFVDARAKPGDIQVSPEELRALVEEAARRGVPVMAHAHDAAGIKMAVNAGVRTIEHGSFIDEAAADLMVRHGTYLIPTLTVGLYLQEKRADNKVLVELDEPLRTTRSRVLDNMRLALRKGVKFGLGTDDIGWPADYSAKEFSEYVRLGMTPMQAIMCGTRINAEILGKENEIGTVEPDKQADIIAVKGDPLTDISELERVKFVMIGGQIVKNEK